MEQELVVREAATGLCGRVERYWGYRERTAAPVRHREPISTGVVLIFGLGPELRVVDRTDPARAPLRLGSFVGGLDDACAVIEHDGEMQGVQVDLTPMAARMVFHVPMHELTRAVVPLDALLGPEAHRLEERLLDASGWAGRFDIVERFLAGRLANATPPPADVDWAWRRLRAEHGRLRVDALAAELRCSRKHLAARFREHVGLPPKLWARMLRFRRASDLLGSPQAPDLAALARMCGYYDQAHLDRDFRMFAGTTPSAYRADPRAPVPFVQDGAVSSS